MRKYISITILLLVGVSVFGQGNLDYIKSKDSLSIVNRSTLERWQMFTKDTIYADSSFIKVKGVMFNDGSTIISDSINLSGVDSIKFRRTGDLPYSPYRMRYDIINNAFGLTNDISGCELSIGRELWGRGVNLDYALLSSGTVVTAEEIGTGQHGRLKKFIAQGDYSINRMYGVVTSEIALGQQGEVCTYGVVRNIDTRGWSPGDYLFVSSTDSGQLTNVRPKFPDPSFLVAFVLDSLEDGSIYTAYRHDGIYYQFDGTIIDRHEFDIIVDGGNIYADVKKQFGTDLPVQLGSQVKLLDCTTGAGVGGSARVQLTAGTATSPVLNYVYITIDVNGDPQLLSSTAYPTDSVFAFAGYATVLDAATTLAEGPLLVQRTTDAIAHEGRGRISYLDERIRAHGAEYWDGINFTCVVNSTPTPDDVGFTNASGQAYQLHLHDFPARDIAISGIYVANHPTAAYTKITNLNSAEILQTSDGTTLSGKYFNWIVWATINKDTSQCKLFINLPTGSYVSASDAISDPSNYSVTTIPKSMKGTGILVCRLPFRHRTLDGGTYENLATTNLGLQGIDLRGLMPGYNLGGAGISTSTTFGDDQLTIFNFTDNTKQLQFDASQITTGNIRKIIMGDEDISLINRFDNITFIREGESIQAAINAAIGGDVLFINPGVYTENLTIDKDNIALQISENAVINGKQTITGDSVTIIGGSWVSGQDTVFRFIGSDNLKLYNVDVDSATNTTYFKDCSIDVNFRNYIGGKIYMSGVTGSFYAQKMRTLYNRNPMEFVDTCILDVQIVDGRHIKADRSLVDETYGAHVPNMFIKEGSQINIHDSRIGYFLSNFGADYWANKIEGIVYPYINFQGGTDGTGQIENSTFWMSTGDNTTGAHTIEMTAGSQSLTCINSYFAFNNKPNSIEGGSCAVMYGDSIQHFTAKGCTFEGWDDGLPALAYQHSLFACRATMDLEDCNIIYHNDFDATGFAFEFGSVYTSNLNMKFTNCTFSAPKYPITMNESSQVARLTDSLVINNCTFKSTHGDINEWLYASPGIYRSSEVKELIVKNTGITRSAAIEYKTRYDDYGIVEYTAILDTISASGGAADVLVFSFKPIKYDNAMTTYPYNNYKFIEGRLMVKLLRFDGAANYQFSKCYIPFQVDGAFANPVATVKNEHNSVTSYPTISYFNQVSGTFYLKIQNPNAYKVVGNIRLTEGHNIRDIKIYTEP